MSEIIKRLKELEARTAAVMKVQADHAPFVSIAPWSFMKDECIVSNCEVEIKEPFNAMVEFDDYRRRVKTGKISKKEWIRELKNAKCRYYLGKNDIKPFLSVCIHKVKKTLHMVEE